MFWVDETVEQILKAFPDKEELIVRDEKTPSGRVHIGSMRGVVIHGVVAQALNEKGRKTRFIYEFNDADPMDGLPIYLDKKKYEHDMGKPLKDVPSPHEDLGGEEAANYAEYFANEFLKVIREIGFDPEIIYSSELYKKGHYDEWIRKILDHKELIRKIYKDISGSEKPEDWYPLQVVCQNCGKVGSTKVTSWDGEKVKYVCMPDLVEWAKGCGHEGEVSPFGGRGKLPWKVEWPVKWASMNVDIEGSGKDHCAAGGSHDIGEEICKKVLKMPPPFNIPYEFFLFGGAKMSSSKGMGASVKEISETVPPDILRFLMVRKKPNQPIEFNPDGPTIPVLFDQHDETAEYFFHKKGEYEDMERAWHFSQVNPDKSGDHYYPRFTRIAFLEQIPYVDIMGEVEKMKGGKLTKEDQDEVRLRRHYAKIWLEKFAPDSYRFEVQQKVPAKSAELSDEQKGFLGKLADVLAEKDWEGEELHAKIHELKESSPLNPKEAFGAIYMALLGKDSGPQAGWFLEALEKDFLIKRFTEISKM
ncbi:MAG: lysine--tRNA ligase [Candidatus Peregrinibacteria bacterium]